MTTDGKAIFVDTNVLVYASVANAPLHAQVTQNLLTLVQQVAVAGKQIHDANIVATMQTYNISQLLTHNISDFKRFAHLINLLPL